MVLEVYVTSAIDENKKSLNLDGEVELVPVLGEEEELAVKIDDVFKSISSLISESLSSDAELLIELTGSASFKAEGGMKYMVVNVGGSATKENLMKISLKTKISPR